MRTLVLNGSPAPSGHTARLVGELLRHVDGGHEILDAYKANIAPCVACGRCAGGSGCVIRDDMPAIREKLATAPILLIASPIHFSSLTAPLIALFSRLQPEWRRWSMAGKPEPSPARLGGLALTGGATYPRMFEPARAVAAAVFRTLGLTFAGMAAASDTDARPVIENAEAMASARELAERLKNAGRPA